MEERLVPIEVFERIVRDAIDALPGWVAPLVDEMAVIVEDDPSDELPPGRSLLGRYRGFPRTRYGGRPAGSLPDVITLYRLPILASCSDLADVPQRVLKVMGHEVGHSLGLSEDRLRKLGWY